MSQMQNEAEAPAPAMVLSAPSGFDRISQVLERYAAILATDRHGGGGLHPAQAAIWSYLLAVQAAAGVRGDFLEIGVWRGFGQAMMALNRGRDEKLISIDKFMTTAEYLPTLQMVDPDIAAAVELHRTESFDPDLLPKLAPLTKRLRFIHIDGEHSYEAVYNDLEITASLLTHKGLLIIDDFFNFACPSITKATYDFLNINRHRLVMVFSGFNKAYCCHPRDYPFYVAALLDMVEVLEGRAPKMTVAVSEYAVAPGSLSVFARVGPHGYQVVMQTVPTKFAMLEWLGLRTDQPKA